MIYLDIRVRESFLFFSFFLLLCFGLPSLVGFSLVAVVEYAGHNKCVMESYEYVLSWLLSFEHAVEVIYEVLGIRHKPIQYASPHPSHMPVSLPHSHPHPRPYHMIYYATTTLPLHYTTLHHRHHHHYHHHQLRLKIRSYNVLHVHVHVWHVRNVEVEVWLVLC